MSDPRDDGSPRTPVPPDLAALLAQLPEDVPPARDLWPGVREALSARTPVLPDRDASPGALGPVPWARVVAGIAAVAAVAVSSAWVTARSLRAPVPAEVAMVDEAAWERDLRRSTDELLAVLESRRDTMDPEAARSVLKAVGEIDAAIADIRAALREEPDSEELQGALASAWHHKVQVLRAVPELP